jgi:ABC-type multidrug transport system fused ATPase/permease subunit
VRQDWEVSGKQLASNIDHLDEGELTFISGKSTLALSLLRLNEVLSGQILIDGQDIFSVPRSLIRHRISSLSQEPFIFPGSIRQNVDPLGVAANFDIIAALDKVGVWSTFKSTSTSGGHDETLLDETLTETSLSDGQRQLFCLARAILKKSKILILDEPTSRYVSMFQILKE